MQTFINVLIYWVSNADSPESLVLFSYFQETNLMISVHIITPTEERKSDEGRYGMTQCVDNVTKKVKTLYFPAKFIDTIEKDQFYILTNANISANINIQDHSKVHVQSMAKTVYLSK